MVTSAATVGVSPIPTGNDNSPRYDILINACSVDNVGDVDYYIDGVSYDSCGRSPGIGYVDGAYRVGSDGDCVNSGSDGIMHDSYGIAFTPIKFLTFLSKPQLRLHQCVQHLPGWLRHQRQLLFGCRVFLRNSPYLFDGFYSAYYVEDSGYIDYSHNWINSYSYGRSSPGLDNLYDIYAHNVDSYGDISNYAKPNNTVTDSCG